MKAPRVLYLSATSLAPLFLLLVVYFLYSAQTKHDIHSYQFALYALITVVLLMETRVRLGYKTKRAKLFYFHLSFAIPFLITLVILAFFVQPLWLIITCDMLLIILAAVGITLFYRSITAVSRTV